MTIVKCIPKYSPVVKWGNVCENDPINHCEPQCTQTLNALSLSTTHHIITANKALLQTPYAVH